MTHIAHRKNFCFSYIHDNNIIIIVVDIVRGSVLRTKLAITPMNTVQVDGGDQYLALK